MSWPFQCAKQTQPSRKYHWRGNNGKWFSRLHYEPSWYLHMFVDNVGNSAACVPFLTTVLGSRHHVSHLAWAVDAILWLQASRPVGKTTDLGVCRRGCSIPEPLLQSTCSSRCPWGLGWSDGPAGGSLEEWPLLHTLTRMGYFKKRWLWNWLLLFLISGCTWISLVFMCEWSCTFFMHFFNGDSSILHIVAYKIFTY